MTRIPTPRIYALAVILAALVVGCAGPRTFQAVSVTESVVDKALIAWCDYCAWAQKQPSTSPSALLMMEGRVKLAYETYRKAMNTFYELRPLYAKGLKTEADYVAAQTAWQDAAMAFTALVEQLMPKATP